MTDMEDKIERLRDYISNIEMDERDKSKVLGMIDDIERDLDIQEEAYNYLSDEDNYE